jgi:Uma2 family endonuclease
MQPQATQPPTEGEVLPDHTQLPDKDGAIVVNYQEHPQSNLLTDCLRSRLHELYGDQFSIGCDRGIYWRYTTPPLDGCKAPDWFLVPGVPPMLEVACRRSYVLWREAVKPLIVIEYVSGDGSEERDQTPYRGKFWVYEQGISASYYVIFDAARNEVEVHKLDGGRYRRIEKNAAGRYAIEPLGIELGIWEGKYRGMELPWLRVWDAATGKMILLSEERAEVAEAGLDETRRLLDEETERSRRLAEKLRQLGVDPDAA